LVIKPHVIGTRYQRLLSLTLIGTEFSQLLFQLAIFQLKQIAFISLEGKDWSLGNILLCLGDSGGYEYRYL